MPRTQDAECSLHTLVRFGGFVISGRSVENVSIRAVASRCVLVDMSLWAVLDSVWKHLVLAVVINLSIRSWNGKYWRRASSDMAMAVAAVGDWGCCVARAARVAVRCHMVGIVSVSGVGATSVRGWRISHVWIWRPVE